MKQLLIFIFLWFSSLAVAAQIDSAPPVPESIPKKDTARPDTIRPTPRQNTQPAVIRNKPVSPAINDTIVQKESVAPVYPEPGEISRRPLFSGTWKIDRAKDLTWQVMNHHPYFGFDQESVVIRTDRKFFKGKEAFFYLIIILLLIYALLKTIFPKYFSDLFRLFFRTTIKQRQIKEQLMQTPLPSILLNGFFAISAGLYLSFVIEHYKLNPVGNFWLLFLYCVLGLSGLYLVKFLTLKLTGWIFRMRDAVDSYIFIVFIINKMAGLMLLPFLVMLAFTGGGLYSIALSLSFFVLAILLAYRFILTYSVVRNQVKVNPFHFFLYLCAFEIAPLLLVYKLLLIYFGISA